MHTQCKLSKKRHLITGCVSFQWSQDSFTFLHIASYLGYLLLLHYVKTLCDSRVSAGLWHNHTLWRLDSYLLSLAVHSGLLLARCGSQAGLWNSSDREKCLSCFGPNALRDQRSLGYELSPWKLCTWLCTGNQGLILPWVSVTILTEHHSGSKGQLSLHSLPSQIRMSEKRKRKISLNPNTVSSNCIILSKLLSYC